MPTPQEKAAADKLAKDAAEKKAKDEAAAAAKKKSDEEAAAKKKTDAEAKAKADKKAAEDKAVKESLYLENHEIPKDLTGTGKNEVEKRNAALAALRDDYEKAKAEIASLTDKAALSVTFDTIDHKVFAYKHSGGNLLAQIRAQPIYTKKGYIESAPPGAGLTMYVPAAAIEYLGRGARFKVVFTPEHTAAKVKDPRVEKRVKKDFQAAQGTAKRVKRCQEQIDTASKRFKQLDEKVKQKLRGNPKALPYPENEEYDRLKHTKSWLAQEMVRETKVLKDAIEKLPEGLRDHKSLAIK